VDQRRAPDRRRKEKCNFRFAERQRGARSRPEPVERDENRQCGRGGRRDVGQLLDRERLGERTGGRRRRREAAKKHEIEIGDADDRADEVFGLLEAPEARCDGVAQRHDTQIEQSAKDVAHAIPPCRPSRE
jgi:hypothetical protein